MKIKNNLSRLKKLRCLGEKPKKPKELNDYAPIKFKLLKDLKKEIE